MSFTMQRKVSRRELYTAVVTAIESGGYGTFNVGQDDDTEDWITQVDRALGTFQSPCPKDGWSTVFITNKYDESTSGVARYNPVVFHELPNYDTNYLDGSPPHLTDAILQRGLDAIPEYAPGLLESRPEEWDAIEADAFLQLCAFGVVVYG